MFRFTRRDLLWLMVVVGMSVAVWFERSTQVNDRRAVIRRASDQELAAISARYQAAKGDFEWHVTHKHLVGERWLVDATCGAIERFAYATETSNDLETQVKDLASALELAQYVAASTQDKYEKNLEPMTAVHRVQYTLAEIELRLRRAEEDRAATRATK